MSEKTSTKKQKSMIQTFKECLDFKSEKKIFPWYQSGILLLGISIGILIASAVHLIAYYPRENASTATLSDAEKCRAQNGRLNKETEVCEFVTPDNKDSCTKNSDCTGWCLAPEGSSLGQETTGTCSESFNVEGCVDFLDEGMVNQICLP